MRACYYRILGVTVEASQEEIKRAFRLLALRWHPDRNPHDPNASNHFRDAVEAYETLTNPTARRLYDRRRGYIKGRRPVSQPVTPTFDGEADDVTLNEVIKDFFGVDFRHFQRHHGNDLRFDLQVSRDGAHRGFFEEIRYERVVYCPACLGKGFGATRQLCLECRGNGEREEPCSLRLWVPAGSEGGSRLRVPGAGDILSPGGTPGDLVVFLYVADEVASR